MATIRFQIVGDARDIKKALADIKKQLKGVKLESEKSSAALGSLKSFALGGLKIAGGLIAVRTLRDIGVAAVKAGQGIQESESLFSVSMGRMGESARRWSEETGAALGLNRFQLRESIGIFNNMLSSMGLSEQGAFDMSKSLVQLSHDMESFFNLRPGEGFEKLRAGITGEAEPLKRLGILINEATVKQHAYTQGIAAHGSKLSEVQKVQARFAAIMAQTGNVQGDLLRTQDSSANMQRRLNARWSEFVAIVGKAALPAYNTVLSFLLDAITGTGTLAESQVKLAAGIALPIRLFLNFGKNANAVLSSVLSSIANFVTNIKAIETALLGAKRTSTDVFLGEIVASQGAAEKASADYRQQLVELNLQIANMGRNAAGSAPAMKGMQNILKGSAAEAEKLSKFLPGGEFGRQFQNRPGTLQRGLESAPVSLSRGGLGVHEAQQQLKAAMADLGETLSQAQGPLDQMFPLDPQAPTGIGARMAANFNEGLSAYQTFMDEWSVKNQLFKSLVDGMGQIAGAGLTALGRALAGGGDDVAKQVGEMFGGLLSQIGSGMVAQGITEILTGSSPMIPRPDYIAHGTKMIAVGAPLAVGGGFISGLLGGSGTGAGAGQEGFQFSGFSAQTQSPASFDVSGPGSQGGTMERLVSFLDRVEPMTHGQSVLLGFKDKGVAAIPPSTRRQLERNFVDSPTIGR